MLIYPKGRRVDARIYLRNDKVILRLFLSGIDDHRAYLEAAPEHVRKPFVDDTARCRHCHDKPDGSCKFRKSYTLEGSLIEKCNGLTFEYPDLEESRSEDLLALLKEFHPVRKERTKS